ncbi:hypothetical protein D0U04_29250 [Bacillus clarus]|uniref:Uncharacterized protein n=1 Tax=Bacillus clarus TaxID=2338372 RepID=A0A090YST6_9BACI|nr:hypothetical protein [Bacillus clarus]KFM95140.1 hypothetical protein DJ93_5638 [Bacillus clarus]RFT62099.1 hypothetical protein D0U04_29250 [Bacillus clarus]
MAKPFVIKNKRSLSGETTTPVLVTIKAWQKLVEALEGKFYSFKDTYLEDIVNSMSYEERIADEEGFVEKAKPSFSLQMKNLFTKANGRKHKLYGITNADLEVFLFLHKKCNTYGELSHVSIHMLWEDYKNYKEAFAHIHHSQFYVALKKLSLHNIITIEKEYSGKYKITLTDFMNKETNKANPYTFISPIVFTKEFFELSIAAKKLFIDVAMQQKRETTLKRSLYKVDEQGQQTHFGGMYRFLHKKYPHQIRSVMNELTTKLTATESSLFRICKLEKGKKNKKQYTTLHLSVHPDFLCDKEAGAEYRDPFTPRLTYKRKAKFIEDLLVEMNIAEFAKDMNQFVNVLKHSCHRQIRQVIRGLREMIDRQEGYPKKLVYTLSKLLKQSSQYRVLDTAAKTGIYSLITHNVPKDKQEDAIFKFGTHFAIYSLQNVKKLFGKAHDLLHAKYAVPVTEDAYHRNYMQYQEESLFRKYAFEQGVNVNAYIALEIEIRELLKSHGHKGHHIPSDIRELFIEKIDRLPKENIRVIEVPEEFNLILFLQSLEAYYRKTSETPHTVDQLLPAI